MVGANAPTVLSTIVQLDPIYVNFTASERDVLQVRADLARAGRTTADVLGLPVEMGLQTESGFPTKASSTILRRPSIRRPARWPPAPSCKIPIGYCCPAISCACASRAAEPSLLVSDVAFGSDQGGRYVLIVNKDNVVEQRKVEPGQLIGELRVIEKGLTKDDRVVIGGIMRAIPGQKVKAELRTLAAANQ